MNCFLIWIHLPVSEEHETQAGVDGALGGLWREEGLNFWLY